MNHSIKVGLSFGLTSGIITTLGLMVGLFTSTNSKLVVLSGILIIALADSLSDAFGIHISEESENKHTPKEVWTSTISTFGFKLITALTFIIPVLIFELQTAIIISIVWGLILLSSLTYYISKEKPLKNIVEHISIAIAVIILTYFIGKGIALLFI